MKAVHRLASLIVQPRNDGLGVAVGVDRQLKQRHLWSRDGVGVVVVRLDLLGRDPEHEVDRVVFQR